MLRALALLLAVLVSPTPARALEALEATVVRVVDGDTIEVRLDGRLE